MAIFQRKKESCNSGDHNWKDKKRYLNPDKVVERNGLLALSYAWYVVHQKCTMCGEKRVIEREEPLDFM